MNSSLSPMRTIRLKVLFPLEDFLAFPVQDDDSAWMDEDVLMDDDDRTDEDASMDEDDRTDKDALTNHGMSLKDYIRNRIDSQTRTQEVVKSIGEYQNASYDTELPDDKAVQYILDELINDSAEGVAIKNCVLKRLEMEDKALLRMLLCSLEDLKDLEDDALSFTVAKLRKEDWDRALMHMCIIYHVPIMETFNTAADVLHCLLQAIRDTHCSPSALTDENALDSWLSV